MASFAELNALHLNIASPHPAAPAPRRARTFKAILIPPAVKHPRFRLTWKASAICVNQSVADAFVFADALRFIDQQLARNWC